MANCRILEEIGSPVRIDISFRKRASFDWDRAAFVIWHARTKTEWLPKLVTGEQLGAFCPD